MGDFTITERTEPFTLDEVFSFIDETHISKNDSHELKSRIVDAVQGIREKVIDEFAEQMKWEYRESIGTSEREINFACAVIEQVAERMKGGAIDG
jgi:hypothetical protein